MLCLERCRQRYPSWYSGGGSYGSVGGLICCNERQMNKCPRIWT